MWNWCWTQIDLILLGGLVRRIHQSFAGFLTDAWGAA
jgi:hypothetical protein